LFDAKQRRFLIDRITEVVNPAEWFDGFRHGLIKGEPPRPPQQELEDEGINSEDFYLALDTLKELVLFGRNGVPRQKRLQRLQQAKDDPGNGLGLRFAFSALLSRCEVLLLAKGDTQPVPAAAFWRWGSRLGRGAFFWQVLAVVLITPVAALMSGTPTSGTVVMGLGFACLLGVVLRRLHDLGRGVATLLAFGLVSVILPFLPLTLFFLPGDQLLNRYGVPPDSAGRDALPGGLQAALRQLET
jgi:uncharacterized membrane protein YhaH (DUF805 family)